MHFHAYAPTRIDLAGGTLDLWPLYLFHPGALTLNVAITRSAHAIVEPRGDRRIVLVSRDSGRTQTYASLAAVAAARFHRLPLLAELVVRFAPKTGLALTTWSEAPAGAGLGGSSALAVAICAALTHWQRARMRAAEWIPFSRDIEARVLGVPTGEQDHYPAVFGGLSAIHLEPGKTWREPLRADLRALEARLLLVYTGAPRRSGINNWKVMKNYLDGDRRLRRNFALIAATATRMREALRRGDWRRFASLLRREWETRRRNAPGISTPFIDTLVKTAYRHGAEGAKVCGAGGGGCVVFVTPPEKRAEVASALAAAGATLLPFRIARRGVQVRRLA
jgi:D-glycero-alpha-D-manno-heptose-7-phosphate kinase